MNNKIKKGLGYFSFFILALGMLPLGNIPKARMKK